MKKILSLVLALVMVLGMVSFANAEAAGMDAWKPFEERVDAINKIIAAGLTDQAPLGLGIPTSAYVQNFSYRDKPVDEAEWAMHSSLGTACFSWEPTKAMAQAQECRIPHGLVLLRVRP